MQFSFRPHITLFTNDAGEEKYNYLCELQDAQFSVADCEYPGSTGYLKEPAMIAGVLLDAGKIPTPAMIERAEKSIAEHEQKDASANNDEAWEPEGQLDSGDEGEEEDYEDDDIEDDSSQGKHQPDASVDQTVQQPGVIIPKNKKKLSIQQKSIGYKVNK